MYIRLISSAAAACPWAKSTPRARGERPAKMLASKREKQKERRVYMWAYPAGLSLALRKWPLARLCVQKSCASLYIFFSEFLGYALLPLLGTMPLGIEREPRGSHTRFLFVFFFYSFGGGWGEYNTRKSSWRLGGVTRPLCRAAGGSP